MKKQTTNKILLFNAMLVISIGIQFASMGDFGFAVIGIMNILWGVLTVWMIDI